MKKQETGSGIGFLLKTLLSHKKYIFFKKLKKLLTVRIIHVIIMER